MQPPKHPNYPSIYKGCFASKIVHYLIDLNSPLLKPQLFCRVGKRGLLREFRGLKWVFHLLVLTENK